MRSPAPDFPAVVEELSQLVSDLRAALQVALRGLVPDNSGARACGRALGISRGLGWSVYTVLTVSDPPTVLRAMPRGKGWGQLVVRLQKLGRSAAELAALKRASERLLARLESSVPDRRVVRAAASGGLDTPQESTAMARARRSMRASAEQVLGLRSHLQIGAFVVSAPSRARQVDIVGTLEFEGLKRIRPGYPFPIFQRVRAWHPTSKGLKSSNPLQTSDALPGLVTDLSTKGIAGREVRLGDGDEDRTFYFHGEETADGPGIRAAFAEHLPRAGTVGGEDDRAELDLAIHQPTAFAVMEVWLHRAIVRRSEPAAVLTGMYGEMWSQPKVSNRVRIPLEVEAKPIESAALPARLRADRGMHEILIGRAAKALRTSISDLVGYRVVVPDPPIGSRVMLKWKM